MPEKRPKERESAASSSAPIVAEPAEVVTTELVALEAVSPEIVPSGVFSTTDPAEAIRQASRLIKYVNEMIAPRRKDFISVIQGRDFPKATWWTAVGQPLGLSPRTVWVKRRDDFELETWEARVEVYNRADQLISAGQALCGRGEGTDRRKSGGKDARKLDWESYALYSFAQTRATGKAYRTPLSFLAVLADLEPTPAEEMDEGPPIAFPGDGLDWDDVCDDIKVGLKHLGWGDTKARSRLAKFLNTDGTLDEDKAVAFLSAELAKADQEAGR